ncbi:outer membrane protein assembly factor BamB family protein [Micromonospora auratinigra]|uniref:PQQ-like domain-containing protein n=1 Tax=Micromonospora auratinigra TaxID=261654 RepID=A0A1A8Z5G7_9ACTN|nr:PQQ-binding-like beta-propeller repeat protein [Micromonospora auratinigra]SBT39179.1 PQQ-like domain-containing protein [Micromonospora auratinigra]
MPSYRPSRWCAAGLALGLVAGLAACSPPRAESPERPSPAASTDRKSHRKSVRPAGEEGPTATWSLRANRIDEQSAQVGPVIVIPDERELRAVDRATGADRWRHSFARSYRYTVADGLIVVTAGNGDGPLEVLDPATGAVRWRADDTQDVVVHQKTVYDRECVGTGPSARCAVVAHDIRDGRRLWRLPSDRFASVSDKALGARTPYAPATDRYLPARLTATDGFHAVAAGTGKLATGRLPSRAWYGFMAGDLLVTTDNDPPQGDRQCTVTIATVDAATGAKRWSGPVYSGRRENGDCQKWLTNRESGMDLIGAGTRLVAVTATGRPQLVDLGTGKAVWVGATPGVPIDGDDRSVLVRRTADEGELALLDLETGTPRWTAPDPGLSGQSASWHSTVTGRLVAVSGATGDRPFVLVLDVATGRQLGRYPGWVAGAGEDWVAVTHSGGPDGITLDLHTF